GLPLLQLSRLAVVMVELTIRAPGVHISAVEDNEGARHLARVPDLAPAGLVDALLVERCLEGATAGDGPVILDLAGLQVEGEEMPVRPGVADDLLHFRQIGE